MFEDDSCVVDWLGHLAPSTRRSLPFLIDYFRFIGWKPSEAVEYQRKLRDLKFCEVEGVTEFYFLDQAYKWLKDNVNLRVSTKKTRFNLVRGFFRWSRAAWPVDRKQLFHSEKEPVTGKLSVDAFRKLLLSCNSMYKAALLCKFQGGMDTAGLLYFNRNCVDSVWRAVQKGSKLLRVTLPGRKATRNITSFFTFIGSDALECLRQHFHSQGWRKDTVLFRTEQGQPLSAWSLSKYFLAHALKTGVVKAKTPVCPVCGGETVRERKFHGGGVQTSYNCVGCQRRFKVGEMKQTHGARSSIRYGCHPHELRDLFRTEWHRAQSAVGVDYGVAEVCMGHGLKKIDPLLYDKIMSEPEYAEAQYRRAMPFLNILSEDPRVVARGEVEDQLAGVNKRLADTERELGEMKRLLARVVEE